VGDSILEPDYAADSLAAQQSTGKMSWIRIAKSHCFRISLAGRNKSNNIGIVVWFMSVEGVDTKVGRQQF
jgi:hypothetical protein